jgi:hypothetical protein
MALKLYVDYRRKRLVVLTAASRSSSDFTLPPWVQNDNVPIEVAILDDDGALQPLYTRRDPLTYGLRVGLFVSGATTQLAYQSTFTVDSTNKVQTANLTANSANQTAALTQDKIDVALEIEITSDGGLNYETVLPRSRGATTLEKEAIASAASTVPANDTAVTVANLPGLLAALLRGGFILRNDTAGIERNFYLDDNGVFQGGQITPLP